MAFADLSDPQAVSKALDEFDAIGQEAFLKKYGYGPARTAFVLRNGNRYDAKAILGAAHGYQFPDQGPLSWQVFSGGEAAAAPKLRSLGFEVTSPDSESIGAAERSSMDPDDLRVALQFILDGYRDARLSRSFGKSDPIWDTFEQIKSLLQASDPVRRRPHLLVSWSCGQGNWSRVPWIALLDSRETTTTQRGVYAVYLFREDLSGVYLTLNQGVTEPLGRLGRTEGREELRRRASDIRTKITSLPDDGFQLDSDVDLRTSAGLGLDYERGTIAHRFYESGQLPRGTELVNDVEALLAAYEEVATSTPTPAVAERDLRRVVESFADGLIQANISFGDRHVALVRAFVASLATKPFAILTGLSGSGKTQLALKFGEWLGHWDIVPVRPDWTGAESLFGYEDALQKPLNGRPAWYVPDVLEFMLGAVRDPESPYLLLLDEMNLAHVERYFADVLSGMESQDACLPDLFRDEDGQWRKTEQDAEKLRFPRNLFVVGTVNVDETTYMFSPKVLDRANTIEFRVNTGELSSSARKPIRCAPGDPALVRGFLEVAMDDAFHIDHPAPGVDQLGAELRRLHRLLSEANFEFGHRVFYEALRFSAMLNAAGESSVETALDLQLLQKVLPRLHGSRRRLESLLAALGRFCFDLAYEPGDVGGSTASSFDVVAADAALARLPLSFDKVRRMVAILRTNQFVSFAE